MKLLNVGISSLGLIGCAVTSALAEDVAVGVAIMKPTETAMGKANPNIKGTATFTQKDNGDVDLTLDISGLPPNSEHGIHVHQHGDATVKDSLDTIGLHFVPFCNDDPANPGGFGLDSSMVGTFQAESDCKNDQVHGLPPSEIRQPGDCGNGQVDADGNMKETITLGQGKLSLTDASRSIVGRAFIIHEQKDDGLPPFGNAGGAIAYGVIGIMVPGEGDKNIAVANTQPAVTTLACEFQSFDGADKATGLATLTFQFENGKNMVRLNGQVSGLEKKEHSFHFHTYGDMRGPAESLGDIYDSSTVAIELLDVEDDEASFDFVFESKDDAMTYLTGRSLTIHDGPSTSDPTIARAVCGISSKPNSWNEALRSAAGAPALSMSATLMSFALAGAAWLRA